jgi:hypothetical protein
MHRLSARSNAHDHHLTVLVHRMTRTSAQVTVYLLFIEHVSVWSTSLHCLTRLLRGIMFLLWPSADLYTSCNYPISYSIHTTTPELLHCPSQEASTHLACVVYSKLFVITTLAALCSSDSKSLNLRPSCLKHPAVLRRGTTARDDKFPHKRCMAVLTCQLMLSRPHPRARKCLW